MLAAPTMVNVSTVNIASVAPSAKEIARLVNEQAPQYRVRVHLCLNVPLIAILSMIYVPSAKVLVYF